MIRQLVFGVCAVSVCCALVACTTAPRTEGERAALRQDVRGAIAAFVDRDPSMQELLDDSYAYAVFPSVGKGGLGVGAAHGRGIAFEQGEMVGYCDLSQGTFGAQIGGQEYRQVIFFENDRAFNRFKRGQFALAAQASAIAARSGASADADFSDGVIVFTMGIGGAMLEASVGGQNFDFEPIR